MKIKKGLACCDWPFSRSFFNRIFSLSYSSKTKKKKMKKSPRITFKNLFFFQLLLKTNIFFLFNIWTKSKVCFLYIREEDEEHINEGKRSWEDIMLGRNILTTKKEFIKMSIKTRLTYCMCDLSSLWHSYGLKWFEYLGSSSFVWSFKSKVKSS